LKVRGGPIEDYHIRIMPRDSSIKSTPSKIHPWVIQPILFICAIGFLFYNPVLVTKQTPDIFFGLWQQNNHTVGEYIPQFPTDQAKILRLGELFGRLDELRDHNLTNTQYIDEIATLFNFKNSSQIVDKLDLIKARLLETTKQGSLFSRILGFFSFVNLLWFGSICGIVILFFPFLSAIFGPIILQLGTVVIEFLIKISPAIEPMTYLFSYLLIVQGLRYVPDVGLFISLTGCLALGCLMVYSDYKHKESSTYESDETRLLKQQVFHLFLFFAWAPVALIYQSKLLGFLSVGAFFAFLGFSVVCRGLCWLIGYENEYLMQRSCVSSLILMITFILIKLKVLVVSNPLWFEPFSTGVLTFGMISYFLSLLIISSKYYYSRNGKNSYASCQMMMVLSLFFALLIGSVYQFAPLYNIGLTFLVIYVMEKIHEIDLENILIIVLFLGCVCVYLISLYLQTHPDFIMNMFDASLMANV